MNPASTGSVPNAITIGMLRVARLAAAIASLL
jgi:hypothetical protein